jgi:hypothetical protein
MDRYEIKFKIIFPDGEKKTIWNQMMCVPREGETIREFHTGNPAGRNEEYDGEVIDVQVSSVEYCRVGKYDDGSHGIEVTAYVI